MGLKGKFAKPGELNNVSKVGDEVDIESQEDSVTEVVTKRAKKIRRTIMSRETTDYMFVWNPSINTWYLAGPFGEFIGSAVWALVYAMANLVAFNLVDPAADPLTKALLQLLLIAPVVASAYTFLSTIFAYSTGAHFNPFISLYEMFSKRLCWKAFAFYVIAQFVGWLLGTAGGLIFFDETTHIGTPVLGPDMPAWRGMFAEGFCMFIVLMALALAREYNFKSTYKVRPFQGSVVTGLAIYVVTVMFFFISGASFNMWRFTAPAIITNTWHSYCWIYYVGPFLGILGMLIFDIIWHAFHLKFHAQIVALYKSTS